MILNLVISFQFSVLLQLILGVGICLGINVQAVVGHSCITINVVPVVASEEFLAEKIKLGIILSEK